MTALSYREFLESKIRLAEQEGFALAPAATNPALKPHAGAAVQWALRGGRRAVFAAFGLHKTSMQIEMMRLAGVELQGPTLIVLPLGVRQEFTRDAQLWFTGEHAVRLKFIRRPDEIEHECWQEGAASGYTIHLTNYETVRDGKLDPKLFRAASLDEASVLRGFGGSKTFREFMRLFDGMKYKFVATATPSPNDYIELLAYAAFLEVMDVGEAKAQPLDAKVLTPSGWKPMGDMKVGSRVIAADGSTTRVIGVYPQGERQIYRVGFSDGSATECDGDHLWLTQTQYERNNERRYRQRNPFGDRIGAFCQARATREIAATLLTDRSGKNHTIPMVQPVRFHRRAVPVDPWFLGFLLGDACLRDTSIIISSGDAWIIDRATKCLPEGFHLRRTSAASGCDYSVSSTGNKGGRGPGSNPLLTSLRKLGVLGKRAWEKRIPDVYLVNSIDIRLAILQGLMDADGTVCRNGQMVRLSTSSAGLAQDVQAIVQSLGGTAPIRRCATAKRDAYRVLINLPNGMSAFSLPRKAVRLKARTKYPARRYITSVETVGRKQAQCIAIEHPSRLYVTDDFVVTHNTRFFKRNSEKADELVLHPHKEAEFWLWVASWALFIEKPSDLGFSDEGYVLPDLDVVWHEIPSDHATAGYARDGQALLMRSTAAGVQHAAREKRDSLDARLAKLMEIRAAEPDEHRIIWHDLEDERRALEKAIPDVVTVYGSQDLDERERRIIGFSDGDFTELATKPRIAGSGCNFQRHCRREVFLGIGFKFNDMIQAIHRIQRFGQMHECRVDLIYTEAERPVRQSIEAKWARHNEQRKIMTEIVRKYGLSEAAMAETLARSMGTERIEVAGEGYRLVNEDCVEETRRMAADSIGLIVTSIPFSTQYEYTPSFNDFGHTDDDAHFWRQMDYLTPELLRVLEPGRVAAVHVKDRVTPGGINGFGFQTVSPFSDDCVAHFRKHGFAFLARKTIVTDVVRENNQTYRLGWSEQCKDGSRMGAGMPEYLLLFRKPPTDRSNGYADTPVVKAKREWKGDHWTNEGYSRARWQVDAHGFSRSNGNRHLKAEELLTLEAAEVFRAYRAFSHSAVYDFEHHVKIGETLETHGMLPPTFMLLPPQSWHPDVWTDVTRMLTLNGSQHAKGKEMHLCPLQFDIVDRAIAQFTVPGETVFDPFAGLMTVPYRAVKMGRKAVGVELNPGYFLDGCAYVEAAAREMATPSLFDLAGIAEEDAA